MNYLDFVDDSIKKYFKILSPIYPEWLDEYINTKEMLHQQYISVSCGTIYSNLFDSNFFFSSLDHSIAVALIVWKFTHDKKQTLAGLFHDIATPSFKHCIDFLNGDYINQESTEDLTKSIICNSTEIMSLLNRDNIKLDEVCDYHIYPIADNDSPKLAADRLEYSLSNGLFIYKILRFEDVEVFINDLTIFKNELENDEIGFSNKSIAKDFVRLTSKLSIKYREDKTRYSMQFIAELLKHMSEDGLIEKKDLYIKSESEIIGIIEHSKYIEIFNKWRNARNVFTSDYNIDNKYTVKILPKVRYIDPLVNGQRISKVSKVAKKYINNNLSYNMDKYIYLDFDF